MKPLLSFLVLLISNALFSQTVYDIIASETCSCIQSMKLDLTNTTNVNLEAQLGLCMMKSYSNHLNELQGDDKVELTDSAGMQNLGRKVGMKMLNFCPDILLELSKNVIKENSSSKELILEEPPKVKIDFIEGEIIALRTEQFVTFQVKDKNQRIHNLLLLNYFDSASLFINNEIRIKDKIKISYTETEMYDPKLKEYRYFKIISGLEKIK